MADFTLDTDGRCFFCWKLAPPQSHPANFKWKSEPEATRAGSTPSTHSIQYLSRYLKMDLKKVFIQKEPISSDLLEKVEKARLKAELCQECFALTETFSRLYKKLEKIEMEVKSCANLIRKKLLDAEGSFNLTAAESKDDFMGKLRIVGILRTEAIQKSNKKLQKDSPRPQLQRITPKQMDKAKARNKLRTTSQVNHSSRTAFFKDCIENSAEENHESEFMGNDNLEENYMSYPDDMNNDEWEQPTNNMGHSDMDWVDTGPLTANSWHQEQVKKSPKYCKNPQTGNYKCRLCSKEFKTQSGAGSHHNSVHLKAKLKCNLCGKEFVQSSSLNLHHRTAHIGIRFKCNSCNKLFNYKYQLNAHQQKNGCDAKLLKELKKEVHC